MIPVQGIIGDHILDLVGPEWYIIIIICSNVLLCRIAYLKKSLSFTGTIATLLVGSFVFWNLSLSGWMILIIFFVSSTILTKIARPYAKRVAKGIQKKGGCRDHIQVFANGGPATICAILYGFTGNHSFLVLFGAAIAEANSDTWSGEIGIMSKKKPILISTMKECEPGLSGGVTVVGTFGGFCGSVLIAISWACFFHSKGDFDWFSDSICIALAGFSGAIIDSILGSTVQAHYYDETTDRITEHRVKNGVELPLCKGIEFIDNDAVNFLSNIYSVVFAYLLDTCL